MSDFQAVDYSFIAKAGASVDAGIAQAKTDKKSEKLDALQLMTLANSMETFNSNQIKAKNEILEYAQKKLGEEAVLPLMQRDSRYYQEMIVDSGKNNRPLDQAYWSGKLSDVWFGDEGGGPDVAARKQRLRGAAIEANPTLAETIKNAGSSSMIYNKVPLRSLQPDGEGGYKPAVDELTGKAVFVTLKDIVEGISTGSETSLETLKANTSSSVFPLMVGRLFPEARNPYATNSRVYIDATDNIHIGEAATVRRGVDQYRSYVAVETEKFKIANAKNFPKTQDGVARLNASAQQYASREFAQFNSVMDIAARFEGDNGEALNWAQSARATAKYEELQSFLSTERDPSARYQAKRANKEYLGNFGIRQKDDSIKTDQDSLVEELQMRLFTEQELAINKEKMDNIRIASRARTLANRIAPVNPIAAKWFSEWYIPSIEDPKGRTAVPALEFLENENHRVAFGGISKKESAPRIAALTMDPSVDVEAFGGDTKKLQSAYAYLGIMKQREGAIFRGASARQLRNQMQNPTLATAQLRIREISKIEGLSELSDNEISAMDTATFQNLSGTTVTPNQFLAAKRSVKIESRRTADGKKRRGMIGGLSDRLFSEPVRTPLLNEENLGSPVTGAVRELFRGGEDQERFPATFREPFLSDEENTSRGQVDEVMPILRGSSALSREEFLRTWNSQSENPGIKILIGLGVDPNQVVVGGTAQARQAAAELLRKATEADAQAVDAWTMSGQNPSWTTDPLSALTEDPASQMLDSLITNTTPGNTAPLGSAYGKMLDLMGDVASGGTQFQAPAASSAAPGGVQTYTAEQINANNGDDPDVGPGTYYVKDGQLVKL